jgi:L-lysine 6-transaminase
MVQPAEVHDVLRRAILVEGYPFVLDLENSRGQYLRDARDGRDYLDFFTFYASRPIAFDHPGLREPDFVERLRLAGTMKPSNCDVYTTLFAEFVESFRNQAMGPGMKYLFFIDGGALAVENALKAAFDWKIRKNLARGRGERGTQVIHFRHAFHGRSGYTLSLTNTHDPRKTMYFPKFDWPRIPSPALRFPIDARAIADVEEAEAEALRQIDDVYERVGSDDVACIIIEPVQCEGGDRHFRSEFLHELRRICDERETLLIFDEVQTGMGTTGRRWLYERHGVTPDLVAFAKRAQTGGVMAGPRLDEVDNVFKTKSRISSTFSGCLVDFVRCTKYLEIMRRESLLENASRQGEYFVERTKEMQAALPKMISNVRGVGLLIAFDLPSAAARDDAIRVAREQESLLVLPCGDRSVRLRPALDVTKADAMEGMQRLERAIRRVAA